MAAQLVAALRDGVFRRACVSGTLGVPLRGKRVSAMPEVLRKARALGGGIATDIRVGRRNPIPNLLGRLPNALLLRPMIRQAVVDNRDRMNGVYEELARTGLLVRSEA